jgi:putative DNA methylase
MRKKLIEVALPLEKINAASAREKSIRHGHPSTLHLWWARRPLAAARAVIFAQMVDDPSSWPELFPTEAAQEAERQRLFRLIEQLVLWENTTNEDLLQQAREEIWQSWRRTCADNNDHPRAADLFDPEKLPAFHDPFAGGGALPLEAQRLGLEAYASDLNPVAVLINKAMIEIPPKFTGLPPVNPGVRGQGSGARGQGEPMQGMGRQWRGAQGLAEDVRYYGQWMRDEAEKRIGHLYPKIEVTAEMVRERPDLKPYLGQKLTVIAWLWARTVKSPNPAFRHVDVPLASTFMLSTKPGKEAYVEPVISPHPGPPPPGEEAGLLPPEGGGWEGGYHFTVRTGKPQNPEAVKNGTKLSRGANFRCLMSETPIAGDYIKAEGQAGRMGARLMAIVAEGDRGRVYLSPTPEHEEIARQAQPEWAPDVAMPENPRWFSPPLYGLTTFGDLFTPRQLVALNTFADLVGEARERVKNDYLGARASRPRTPFHRSRLPHWEAGERPQHITFRLADSLPGHVLAEWEAEIRHLPDDKRNAERRRRIAQALDAGYGSCILRDPVLAQIVEDALLHFDGVRYRLHEWAVMPNHVHVLVTPLHGYSLSSIVHSWKSFTAKAINRVQGGSGTVWQEDYFDRMIRDEAHYERVAAYVRGNPAQAGLPEEAWVGSMRAAAARERRAGRPPSDEISLAEGGCGATAYAEAVGVYLGMAISKLSDAQSSLCRWKTTMDQSIATFGRQALPMVWDYSEANVFGEMAGDPLVSLKNMMRVVDQLPADSSAYVRQSDSQSQSLSTNKLISTDPPYYSNIGYADLSDFFYVWLRRTLRTVFPDLFTTLAVPKAEELVAKPYRHGGKEQAEQFFLEGMTKAMRRLAEQAHPAFPVTIYYAFKQAETEGADGTSSTGWETFLDAVIRAGFAITGTWPMRTELSNRLIGKDSNALASSIVLVCRARRPHPSSPPPAEGARLLPPEGGGRVGGAPTVTRRDFVAALKAELPVALQAMQRGNIAPVDLAQASIGPGMAVYTRYGKVIDASGKPLSVREALALINATLDERLAEQEGDFDADTRWALAWFEQYGFDAGEYGVTETLSKAKNTSVGGMVGAGLIASGAGKVRLLRPEELPAQWDPTADSRLTVWEMRHHLVRVLEQGEQRAAELRAQLGAQADIARELAYRLYAICERKKRAAEALAYNSLVQSWPEMARLSQERPSSGVVQGNLFGEE